MNKRCAPWYIKEHTFVNASIHHAHACRMRSEHSKVQTFECFLILGFEGKLQEKLKMSTINQQTMRTVLRPLSLSYVYHTHTANTEKTHSLQLEPGSACAWSDNPNWKEQMWFLTLYSPGEEALGCWWMPGRDVKYLSVCYWKASIHTGLKRDTGSDRLPSRRLTRRVLNALGGKTPTQQRLWGGDSGTCLMGSFWKAAKEGKILFHEWCVAHSECPQSPCRWVSYGIGGGKNTNRRVTLLQEIKLLYFQELSQFNTRIRSFIKWAGPGYHQPMRWRSFLMGVALASTHPWDFAKRKLSLN